MATGTDPSHSGRQVPVLVHLSGLQRGTTQRLAADEIRIGTADDNDVRLTAERGVASHHVALRRRGQSYELKTTPGHQVWVNGEQVSTLTLHSGDVIELVSGGPVLRFRLYPPGSRAYKSIREAFSDCLDCARLTDDNDFDRALVLATGAVREVLTQTPLWMRATVVTLGTALAVGLVGLGMMAFQNQDLQDQLAVEESRAIGLGELLDQAEQRFVTADDLEAARMGLERRLQAADERLGALEVRSEASARVIQSAAQPVVLIVGAYGFLDPESRQPLRYLGLGPSGAPLTLGNGRVGVSVDGRGPVAEIPFTGTAFVVSRDGLLLTNRHVAVPWQSDAASGLVDAVGLLPVMLRFIAYAPGVPEPLEVGLLSTSDMADLAVIRLERGPIEAPPLLLREEPANPGEEVIVMGYPTGMRALMARADRQFLEDLAANEVRDFWEVAQRLSEGGYVTPLSTRGIVGQVSSSTVVYDAETTRGGSGGPVLGLDGRVVAVNTAILAEFGGSNIGVPAGAARSLLDRVEQDIR